MGDRALAFLSRDWAGLAVAVLVGASGAAALGLGRSTGAWLTVVGFVLAGVATLLAVGSVVHLIHVTRVRRQYPAPGRMIDLGGYRVHLLAEGPSDSGAPTVVWMPGGHASGLAFYHLHRMLRETMRSVLIDRPGSGWSDPGPFPRTTAREAYEMVTALEKAGEQGPYVLVGHSFGGLLVANMARRWPERVAALVLVDATPTDTVIYGPPLPVLRQMRSGALRNALPRLLGVHVDFAERRRKRLEPPAWRRISELVEQRLGEAGVAMNAVEGASTRAACAGVSIFTELSATGLAAVAWSTAVYEGDLGDLPVLLVAPKTMADEEFEATAQMVERQLGGVDRDRLLRFYQRSRERYLTVSTQARRVYAPEGTGHNFPYEEPEFLADVVRSASMLGTGGADA